MFHNYQHLAHPLGPWAAEKSRQIATKNILLFDFTVDNTHASTSFFVQLWDAADSGSLPANPDFEEEVAAGSFIPFGWNGGYQFHNGLFVRAVTARGGSTLISGDNAKFSGRALTPFPLSSL